MVDRDASFGHHFLQVSQAERIGHVPTHARQDYIERVMQAFEHSGHGRIQRLHQFSIIHMVPLIIAHRLIATEPFAMQLDSSSLMPDE
ncbi:hypothetical protein [Burkholderia ubonensis]|uniref:hypothetical protein n=1 Tax=Burkholderia ubonensis TaxID=101571 RepID=UPI00075EAD79|nr:hypothetical protein [Burkholderia ubonensis]KVN49674.1 hypothetical protein WJ64_20580 [Burkholderia ubonensis]